MTGPHVIMNNTFDGDGQPSGKAAIYIDSAAPSIIVNNIFHDFDIGAKALADLGAQHVIRNNLYSHCNTNRQNIPEGPGDIVTDDPKFVDEANADYGLTFGSPARGAGTPPGVDIGAKQRKEIPTHGPTNVGVQV